MYQYVQPVKVLAALEWLRVNNSLYKDIHINRDWLHDAAQDDADRWEALSAQNCPLPKQEGSNTNTRQQDANHEECARIQLYVYVLVFIVNYAIMYQICAFILFAY